VSGNITRQEKLFIAWVALVVLVVTSLPYAYGYLTSPDDKQFMGILFDVPDVAQYFSWTRELGQAVLVENKLTPEPNPPIFFNLLWFVLGRIAVFLNLGYAEIYQVFRWAATVFFLAVSYHFCSLFFQGSRERKVAFLTILLSSGLGWMLVAYKRWSGSGETPFPLDVYVAEPNSFFSLMVVIFVLWLKFVELGRLKTALLAGLVGLVLGLEHAYDLLIIYAVLIVFTALMVMREGFSWRHIGGLAIVGGLSVPSALYAVYMTQWTPTWRGVLEQYDNAGVFTPDPFHLLILLGIAFMVAFVGFASATPGGSADKRWLLAKVWFGTSLFLAYLPTYYQIKMLIGWQVPIGILAVYLLYSRAVPALSQRMPRLAQALPLIFLLAILPTNLYLLAWRVTELSRYESPFYLYRDEVQALSWLEKNSDPSDVVLSSLVIGQYVPSISGNKVFWGHWTQTLDFFGKGKQVRRFFAQDTSEEERLELLRGYNVRYVFYGKEERALGPYDPQTAPYLSRAFVASDTAIFRVKDGIVP